MLKLEARAHPSYPSAVKRGALIAIYTLPDLAHVSCSIRNHTFTLKLQNQGSRYEPGILFENGPIAPRKREKAIVPTEFSARHNLGPVLVGLTAPVFACLALSINLPRSSMGCRSNGTSCGDQDRMAGWHPERLL